MKAICVFCGQETEIPIEEVVIHQEGTLTVKPATAPEPYAEFKIRCPKCDKVFSYPCGVWHGGYGEGNVTTGTHPVEKGPCEKAIAMEVKDLTPSEKLFLAIFGHTSWPEGVHHFLSAEGERVLNDVLQDWESKEKRPSLRLRGLRIIRLRFGFEPRTEAEKKKPHASDCRTLDEVRVYFGVTRERIRQIESKVLRELRHPVYSRRLKAYLP